MSIALSAILRIYQIHQIHTNKLPTPHKKFPWYEIKLDPASVQYSYTVVTLRYYPLHNDTPSWSQTDMFKNYLYLMKLCEKKNLKIKWKKM